MRFLISFFWLIAISNFFLFSIFLKDSYRCHKFIGGGDGLTKLHLKLTQSSTELDNINNIGVGDKIKYRKRHWSILKIDDQNDDFWKRRDHYAWKPWINIPTSFHFNVNICYNTELQKVENISLGAKLAAAANQEERTPSKDIFLRFSVDLQLILGFYFIFLFFLLNILRLI